MIRYIVQRVLIMIPVLFGVAVATFLLMRVLPGDPASFFAHTPSASDLEVAALREKLGLNRSLIEQFGLYMGGLLRGDLGESLTTGQPVLNDIFARLPASLELTFFALLLTCAIAIPLGVIGAVRKGSSIDHLTRIVSTIGVCTPTFAMGLLLIYVFFYLLGWTPNPAGRVNVMLTPIPFVTGFLTIDSILAGRLDYLRSSLSYLTLPCITMAVFSISPLARMTRASMLETLRSDYVRTARATGLPARTVLLSFALPNALLPVITTIGMIFSYMLGANILVEKVFSWPGVGSYALDTLTNLDYVPVQAFVLTMAVIYLTLNLVIDIIYGFVDPRALVS